MAAVQGVRKFHMQFPSKEEVLLEEENDISEEGLHSNERIDIFNYINQNIIGKNLLFNGPFGKRKVLHCDYTASGRSLQYIEDYIQDVVLPHYGNTHTTTSVTSLQTSMFRDEARDIIRKCVNASENDVVIFTGSGCTAAVHKLIHALNFQATPVVFVSPFEHHSNLLPWKEIGGKIVWTRVDHDGNADLNHLEENLKVYEGCGEPLVGCFSAASNITGILVDSDAVAATLHKYNALAFFDYASAGPYVAVNMNPSTVSASKLTHKDAVFLSPHKFVGGPGTPGILIAKKRLFVNPVPSGGGGGSVFYVTANHHRYLKEIEVREEGGTPDLVGSIRAGLVFQLKENVKCEKILERDKELLRIAGDVWSCCPNLVILGPLTENKLPIFSFVIKHEQSHRLLHHNFVSVLLNDLFGIQSRGGCACAGPYAQELLGMSEDVALEIETLLLEDQRLDRHHLRRHREYSEKEILRPGFTRINLPYFYDDDVILFILKSVAMVAQHGWKLLPQYLFNPETGEWKYRNFQIFKDRKWIGSMKFKNGMVIPPKIPSEDYSQTLTNILEEAENILAIKKGGNACGDQTLLFGEEGEKLRWFLLPSEAQDYLNNDIPQSCRGFHMPFFPGKPLGQAYKDLNSEESLSMHYCSCSPLHLQLFRSKSLENAKVAPENHTDNNPNTLKLQTMDSLNNGVGSSNNTIGCNLSLGVASRRDNNRADDNSTESNQLNKHNTSGSDNLNGLDEDNNSNVNDINSDTNTEEILPTENTDNSSKPTSPVCSFKAQVLNGNESSLQRPMVQCTDRNRIPVKFHNPPKQIFSSAVEAIEDFNMIKNNDCVLLCLSGGKDSLSMLHVINQYKYYAKKKDITFEFGAVTVDPQSAGYDPSPLKDYLKMLNVPYFFEEQDIIGAAGALPVCESICSFCSRMKRGRIYACARREGYNVIALGQHLDDIAESFLMSTFHNGYLRSMKANYSVREGDLRVVRPLIYVREKDLRSFAEKVKLPVIPENCPACFEAPKERHRMKQLLAQQEVLFPNLFKSLRTALHPLIAKSKTGLEKGVLPHSAGDIDDEE